MVSVAQYKQVPVISKQGVICLLKVDLGFY